MFGSIALGILGLGAIGTLGYAGYDQVKTSFSDNSNKKATFLDPASNSFKIDDARDRYLEALKDSKVHDMPIRDILEDLRMNDKINELDYKNAVKTIDKIEAANGKTLFIDNTDWNIMGTSWSKKDSQNLINLYDKLAQEIPDIKHATYEGYQALPEDIRNSFSSNIPNLENIPAPNYEDVSFGNFEKPVDPVKLWTGQELADLHGLNYDPNHYYDLIKKGTSAALDYAGYQSEQQKQASDIGQTSNVTDYLSSIRNGKAEALAAGASLGARRAQELLKNTEAINMQSTNQANVADDRLDTVQRQILQDAQAPMTSRMYFDRLAQSLSGDSALLYENDSDRYGQDMLSNAEFYKADENLRGQRLYNNANMFANKARAQAATDSARSTASGQADEYRWVFDNFLRADDGRINKAVSDMDDYIFKRYNGISNYDYMLNNIKK